MAAGDDVTLTTIQLQPIASLQTLDNVTSPNETLSNWTDKDLEAFLLQHLGPRYRSQAEAAVLILVYVLIFVTGVAGNACTCLVIVRNKRMHTATNYYLFSLAVSDLLTLLLGKASYLEAACKAYRPIYIRPIHV